MKNPGSLLAIAALSATLFACGKAPDTVEETIRSPAAPPATPVEQVTLPPSGEVTTSVGAQSSPETRQLTPAEQSQVLDLMMNRLADRQSKGLGGGRVKVNAAWEYDGYSHLAPNPASEIPARMVAIDLTVTGHTPDFDPDDIEIVDGITSISYGSDPHLTFIKNPGEVIASPREIPVAPQPTRMLLIYAFPKASQKFTLYYWGEKLLLQPRTFDPSGWGLPFPE